MVGQLRSTAWVSWIATLLWIGVVALESTDLFSASHTSHLLSALLAMLHLHTEEQTVSYLNIVLRKLSSAPMGRSLASPSVASEQLRH